MKLNYPQLAPQLTKRLSSIYMICGDEPFLKQDAVNQIRKAAEKAGTTERMRITPETVSDWEQLYPLLYATSLLAEKRLLELDCRHSMPNATASTVLKEYGQGPLTDTILLLVTAKMDEKTTKSAWYRSLEKAGTVVTIWPLSREQLPQWITQRAQKYKLHLGPDAAVLLADYVEGNLVAAAQTIEKLYLLQPQKTIDSKLLATVMTDEGRFTIFDFVDSLISGHPSRALHLLENLKAEGIAPALIVWGAAREFRLLAEMAQGLQQGATHEHVLQKQRVLPRRQTVVRRFLDTHSVQDCLGYLKAVADIDSMIKGAHTGNVWEGLQWLCLRTKRKASWA